MSNLIPSTDDVAVMRSSSSVTYTVYFDPCVPVFQAKVKTVPPLGEGSYLSIAYEDVTLGAYTDIKPGQMLLVSATDTYSDFLYEGRINAVASSLYLNIAESNYPLDTEYILTVIDTYKPRRRARKGGRVDGLITSKPLPGVIKGMPSALLRETTGTGTFDFSQLPLAVQTFDGATVTSTVYDIPGATYDSGDEYDLMPIVTMPANSHTWGRLFYTLSNGNTDFLAFQLIVQDPHNPSIPAQSVTRLTMNRTWDGAHASITALKNIATSMVMDGTRAVVGVDRRYRGGALEQTLDNVAFVGYLVSETNTVNSISDKSVTFEVSSILEIAARLYMDPIAIRDKATPDAWDEINLPTAQKVVAHVLARYSTVLNLCSLDIDLLDATWYGGDMDMNTGSIGEAVEQVLSEINEALLQNPSGELFLRRDLRFEGFETRDEAPTVWRFMAEDLTGIDLAYTYNPQTGRVILGFRTYKTNRSPSKGGKALAPAIILGNSPETQTRANQLMRANQSEANVLIEAAERGGNLLAVEQTPFVPMLRMQGNGGRLSWMTPAVHQWVVLDFLASLTVRRRTFGQRALIDSLELNYDQKTSTEDLTLALLPETVGVGALILAMLSRNASELTGTVTPPLGPYSGDYPTPSTQNMPDLEELPPFEQGNMGGMAPPMPADKAAEDARPTGEARVVPISFAVGTPVAAGFLSILGAPYLLTLQGSARISGGFTLTSVAGPWETEPPIYEGRDGLAYVYRLKTVFTGFNYSLFVQANAPFYMTSHETLAGTIDYYAGFAAPTPDPPDDVESTSFSGFANVSLGATVRVKLTPVTSVELFADAFYQWEMDEEGEIVNVDYLGVTRGFHINGMALPDVPLFSESHEYTVPWEGDGNNPTLVWADDTYLDNEGKILRVYIYGPNAGT